MSNIKDELCAQLDRRVSDKILEQTDSNLLKKLIANAESDSEAIEISKLGTLLKRTGLHFVPRTEKTQQTIHYFKKNNELSFHTDEGKLTHKLIIGDNYGALQNLLIQYKGKIDVIYIDPPYGKDSMGEFAHTNYQNAITRDNLLSMLYSRLVLAKQLLSDSGVIFCSIDDRNQAYVKCLFDEVMGESSFVANYLWKKTDTPPSLSKKVRKKYEYVLCYGKKLDKKYKFSQGEIEGGDAPLLNSGNQLKKIRFPKGTVFFNIPDGTYEPNECRKIELCENVIVKDGVNQNDFCAVGEWKWKQEMVDDEVKKGTYFLVKSELFSVRFQRNGEKATKTPQNNIDAEVGVGTNETGYGEVSSILQKDIFDNPKPTSLIEFLVSMVNKDEYITVLDFFAGSGTTGHAILDLNKKDDGYRTFILCQLNENLDNALKNASKESKTTIENQIALCDKYNRPHELTEITAERLRRIMTGKSYDGTADYKWSKENEPYGGNLDVYTIGTVANNENVEGKTPFDVIDERLYRDDNEKFETIQEKIDWVCSNFNNAQQVVESDADWQKRVKEGK